MPASGAISLGGGRELDYSNSTRKSKRHSCRACFDRESPLVSTWSNARVIDEITSVFSSSFGLDENEQLKFKYLSVVPGAKVLSVAKVSSSFSWSGHAVASLAGQGCIYILSEMKLKKTNLGQNIKEEPTDAIPININDSDSEHEVEVFVLQNILIIVHCMGKNVNV